MAIATNNKTNTTISVLDTDIVCGRGKGLENFPGNRIFRQFIKQHAAEYGNPKASRSERSQVVQFITSLLIDEGMRFVKRETKGWVVLGDHEVKLKVCSWDACRINETLFSTCHSPTAVLAFVEYSIWRYQVGHALRDAGAEYYRKQQQFIRKEALLNPQPTLHGMNFVSIISEDEGETSDTDDTASSSFSRHHYDLSVPVKIDMEKPFDPRLPFTITDSNTMTKSAEQTIDFCNTHTKQRCSYRDDDANHPYGRAEPFESLDSNVPFSDIFLRFIEDTGDDADVEVANINPHDWLLNL